MTNHLKALAAVALLVTVAQAAAGAVASTPVYLDNGTVKLGIDLSYGGAITYLSQSGTTFNVVNDTDHGRQIQPSYYVPPKPFNPTHAAVVPNYGNWPWNPVQAGDGFGHGSPVLAWSTNGNQLYVKTQPLQWSLNNVPDQCTMETWITLDGNAATVRNRLTMFRTDTTQQFAAQTQEMPALYTVSALHNVYSYSGTQPFTNGAATLYKGGPPSWAAWRATEDWAALVNDKNWGLGIFEPGAGYMIGGLYGAAGSTNPAAVATGYLSPQPKIILDSNIVYDFSYSLILGSLTDIRNYVYAHQPDPRPNYHFTADRQDWTYVNASDTWPVQGHLHVNVGAVDPQIISAPTAFRAEEVTKLYIHAAYHLVNPLPGDLKGQLFWEVNNAGSPLVGDFTGAQSLLFDVINDGQYHTYELDVAGNSKWAGLISQLRLDPVYQAKAGSYVDIDSISYLPPDATVVPPTLGTTVNPPSDTIPEPGTLSLLGAVGMGLLVRPGRKKG